MSQNPNLIYSSQSSTVGIECSTCHVSGNCLCIDSLHQPSPILFLYCMNAIPSLVFIIAINDFMGIILGHGTVIDVKLLKATYTQCVGLWVCFSNVNVVTKIKVLQVARNRKIWKTVYW